MSSSTHIYGHLHLADKLKKSATPSCDIISRPAKYIVIGNFITRTDMVTSDIFNEASVLSEDIFDFVVNDFARNQGLSLKNNFGDSIVVCGTKSDLNMAMSLLGSRFSYAFIDEDGFDSLCHAEDEYRNNGNYQKSKKARWDNSSIPHFDA